MRADSDRFLRLRHIIGADGNRVCSRLGHIAIPDSRRSLRRRCIAIPDRNRIFPARALIGILCTGADSHGAQSGCRIVGADSHRIRHRIIIGFPAGILVPVRHGASTDGFISIPDRNGILAGRILPIRFIPAADGNRMVSGRRIVKPHRNGIRSFRIGSLLFTILICVKLRSTGFIVCAVRQRIRPIGLIIHPEALTVFSIIVISNPRHNRTVVMICIIKTKHK